MASRWFKFLHEVGAAGVLGAFAACLVLVLKGPAGDLAAYAAHRVAIAAVCHWLLVPSLALVIASGLLALAATDAYHNAGWAWFKALLGLSLFEGTLVTVSSSARQAAELATLALQGHPDPVRLAAVLRTERGGLWLLLALSVANIVLGVWRPRFGRARTGD